MANVYTTDCPRLIDKILGDIQKGLADNIGWLDNVFGKAYRLVSRDNTRRYYTPVVYTHGNEYLKMFPDSGLGNFVFFRVDDPQTMNWIPYQQGSLKFTSALIVWFDLRRVFYGGDGRNIEAIKAEFLKVLNGCFTIHSGNLQVSRIYEQAENIYKGYTIDEVDNQFLMHPYGGLRIDLDINVNEDCYL